MKWLCSSTTDVTDRTRWHADMLQYTQIRGSDCIAVSCVVIVLCLECSQALCIVWGADQPGAALTSTSISAACSSPRQSGCAALYNEGGKVSLLNRIYGLALRHK